MACKRQKTLKTMTACGEIARNVLSERVQMIRELADAFGPSGFEDDVLTVAGKWASDLGRIEEDHMRNLSTMDNLHPNDYGFVYMADQIGKVIRHIFMK